MATQPFSWPDYLTLATELSTRTEESCLRTAVSRTYYFVYHLARQRILDNNFPIAHGENSHRQIWEKFAKDPDPRCKMLFVTARQLQGKRQQADYEISYPKIKAEFPAVIEMAHKFAQDLGRLDRRLPVNRGVGS